MSEHASADARAPAGRHPGRAHATLRARRFAMVAIAPWTIALALAPIHRSAVAEPAPDAAARNPAHVIAGKFAADAEQAAKRAKAAETAAREAEQRRADAARRAEESRRKAAQAERQAEQLKTDEAEMLARARAEAEARHAEEARARALRAEADAQKDAARRAAEAERRKAEAAARAADADKAEAARRLAAEKEDEARRRAVFAERARLEEERLEREKAEAVSRAQAQQRAAAAAADTARRTADRETQAARDAEERLIEEAKRADAARRTMEAEREAENAALAEKLRRVEEMFAAEHAPKVPPDKPPGDASQTTAAAPVQPSAPPTDAAPIRPAAGPTPPATPVGTDAARSARATPQPEVITPRSQTLTGPATVQDKPTPPATPVAADQTPSTNVTVLLLMQPGDRGIRRWNKTADPVLCMSNACYVSKGADTDAWRAPRLRALGSLNTLGGRAEACNRSLGCVFRNVDLKTARAWVQPIDLRILRHDRRESREIAADPTCIAGNRRLFCQHAVDGGSYRLWVVPEAVAEKAGPAALLAAIHDGLDARHGPGTD